MNNCTLIILPAYQEEKTIGNVLEAIHSRGFKTLVIDDCSRDHTAEIARRAGSHVISLPVNGGYGVALQTGYKYAFRNDYRYLVQLDSDGQHDPAYITPLLDIVKKGQCDLAIGSRFLDIECYPIPIFRRVGMKLFAAILGVMTGNRFTDPTSGFQAMNRKTLQLFISDAFPRDYPDADMLLMVHKAGLKIRDVPVRMTRNTSGQSMHGGILKPAYYVFRMLLGILVTALREAPKIDLSDDSSGCNGDSSYAD